MTGGRDWRGSYHGTACVLCWSSVQLNFLYIYCCITMLLHDMNCFLPNNNISEEEKRNKI